MLILDVPGFAKLELKHLLLDFNGTLAQDGRLIPGIAPLLTQLSPNLDLHVLTADTFGSVKTELTAANCRITRLAPAEQDVAKRDYLRQLGAGRCVAVGNGRNDALMLREAALGIAVVQEEGAAVAAITSADAVCHSLYDALQLLLKPRRLIATLRC